MAWADSSASAILDAQRQQLVHFHGLPVHLLRDGLPLKQFHNDEVPAFVLFNRMDGADVRVIQRRSGARLALKSLQQLAVLGHIQRKKLQGHSAAEMGILSFIHHTHATRAQFVHNLVMQEGLSDEGINLVHIRRLMVSGRVGVVKETGADLERSLIKIAMLARAAVRHAVTMTPVHGPLLAR